MNIKGVLLLLFFNFRYENNGCIFAFSFNLKMNVNIMCLHLLFFNFKYEHNGCNLDTYHI